ncbi:apolipo protein O-domain-containing protein [Daedaleopsis nitida]|nr:apolipo protein O-domain-containing protein [Daedaleopsis nitida]
MLRLLASRRGLALAAVAVGVHDARDKLPIYPAPEPEVVLADTPSELEKQIGVARRAVTGTYLDAHARVQAVVSRWIGVEQAVESRVKSLVAPDEPLTPGILYVGVATLTGSVLARNRLFWRLTLPPTLFLLSLNHFLPKTSHNVSSYLGSLEDAYLPSLAEKHEIVKQHSAMTWERVKDATQNGRESFSSGVAGLVGKVEEATGLKLRETLGWRERAAAVEKQAKREVSETVVAIEEKAHEVREVVEKKVEETKRLV